jgi:hypothetical protein
MKKYTVALFIGMMAVSLTSCLKESEDIFSILGTVTISNDEMIIETDVGERLLVNNPNSATTIIQHNDRVIVDFTLVNKDAPEGIDYVINIHNITKVLFKPVIVLTEEIADSIGNDEVEINSLWLEKNYLNLSFSYRGGNELHLINLIRYPGEIIVDTIDLEIRHNDNDDKETSNLTGFVTFDLSSLRNDSAESVVLNISARGFYNQTYQKYFTYHY